MLFWDQQTRMPLNGVTHRAEQSALIKRLIQTRLTSADFADSIQILSDNAANLTGDTLVTLRECAREVERARKVPPALTFELSKVAVLAEEAWWRAKALSDYSTFSPWLQRIIELKRNEAQCIGDGRDLYEALLDYNEPGETVAGLDALFTTLEVRLRELLHLVEYEINFPNSRATKIGADVAAQARFARSLAEQIGFDFTAGRLDISSHPFCAPITPSDVRITSRFDSDDVLTGIFATLHETGHALYDQGLPMQHFETPIGRPASLAIHESQARFWESLVGRSEAFWSHFLPKLREVAPTEFREITHGGWVARINRVARTLIRTDADDVTYNLHIILRFRLERALIGGALTAEDVPAAWNEGMQKYVGAIPANDAAGCLQDAHWSSGGFGTFPSYTLGNLYAAQFYETAAEELGDFDPAFAAGDFRPILDWLRRKIYAEGRRFAPRILARRVTGADLSVDPLLRHLTRKMRKYTR
jgi:carboxypeptidase Taq